MKRFRNEADTAWKQIIDSYFKDFIDYCLPDLSELIDTSKPWSFLDKELESISKGNIAGRRLLDKLIKVFLKNGNEQWILVHLEIQDIPNNNFPKRMFTYFYRIYDKYEKQIFSCAILTDDKKNWRPDSFEVRFADSWIGAGYRVIKLIDYQDKKTELEASINPFASVILMQLAAIETKGKSDKERKKVKFALTKRLYEKGFSKTEVLNLYQFIDWLIGLPKPLELEYLDQVYQLESENKMPYISHAEKFGIEKGIQQGIQQGMQQGIQQGMQQGIQQGVHVGVAESVHAIKLLKEGKDIEHISKMTGLTVDEIRLLKDQIVH